MSGGFAVNLFQDVPADRIPISVTDTNTLVVIISKICGFPINTAGKSISAEKSTAPNVPRKYLFHCFCRISCKVQE